MNIPDTILNRRLEHAWRQLRARLSPEAMVQIEDSVLEALVGPISSLGRLIPSPAGPKSSSTGIVVLAREIEREPLIEGIVAVRLSTDDEFKNAQIVDLVKQQSIVTVAMEVNFRADVKGSKSVKVNR